MAQKRMFSREITDSDSFLDLSLGAQCLYFHVCLAADDEGFISAGKRIARAIGASDNDLNELVQSGFLLFFPESGIYVAVHFWVNNTLKSDRFHPTVHQVERKQLELTENKVYILRNHDGNNMEPDRNQNGSQYSIAQERKEEIRKDDIRSGEESPEGRGSVHQEDLFLSQADKYGIKADVEEGIKLYGFERAHQAFFSWRDNGKVIGKYKEYLKNNDES